MDESILVIPATAVNSLPVVNGFTRDVSALPELLKSSFFMPRPAAETDENFKQIIPYSLLKYGMTYFYYMRTKKVSEKRLSLNFSLGVGGHINPEDDSAALRDVLNIVDRAREREIEEEFDCRLKPGAGLAGFINDNTSPVSRVHLGIVYIYELIDNTVTPRETANFESTGFDTVDGLRCRLDDFENWSRILITDLLA